MRTMMGNHYLLESMRRLIGIGIGFRRVGYLVVRLLLGSMTSCRCSCLLLGRKVQKSKTGGRGRRWT
jgi:hypothetical protein